MYDVVIIGGGISGLTCALEIEKTKKVLVLTKKSLVDCNSYLAQGGIAATTKLADVDLHVLDTLNAGCNLNDIETSKHIIKAGKGAIDFLVNNNVKFDKKLGKYHLTKEAAHSKRRIFHAGGDQTGKMIMQELIKNVENRSNITILNNARALEFSDDKLIFSYFEQLKAIKSDNFVLALGGISHLFSISTSSDTNIGDFVHLAKTAKLKLSGMQYIQFHPTAFYNKKSQPNFLISEALRGEGAILKNHDNYEFMNEYHELKSLAPRDVVARAIISEMNKQKKKFMYLDMKNRGEEFYIKHFPKIYKHLKEFKIDMNTDLIPVCPAAHYTIGGIYVNQFGQTNKSNIYASGECASSGMHGANRLASNSLLECIVLSQEIARKINEKPSTDAYEIKNMGLKLNKTACVNFSNYQRQFQENLFIIRDLKQVKRLKTNFETAYFKEINKDITQKDYDKLSALSTGITVAKAIINNPISVGSNYIKEKDE